MYFIDTNIFLRVAIKQNEKVFRDCSKLLELITKNKIEAVTAGIVLSEMNWTLLKFYGISKPDIVRTIKSIINLNGLVIKDNYNMPLALSLYESFAVKFIDAQIASIPHVQNKEWTIVSYDRDFDKINVLRKEPQDIL